MESIESIINHLRKFTGYDSTWSESIYKLQERESQLAQSYGDYRARCSQYNKEPQTFKDWLAEGNY
jgi:hypothetical protein